MLSENGKAELQAIARNMGATLLLLRVGGDGDTMFPVPGAPQVLEVEVGAQTMGDLVDLVASIARPDNSTALLSIAGHLNQSGVTARQEGRYSQALLRYRFALAVAWYLGTWDGVESITDNLQCIRASLDDLLRVNVTPPFPDGPKSATLTELTLIAGNIVMAPAAEGEQEHAIRALAALIRADAAELRARAEARGAADDNAGDTGLLRIQSLCRLAGLAGDRRAWRVLLARLCARADALRRHDIALAAALDRLADATTLDLLVGQPEDGGTAADQDHDDGFRDAWALFLRERDHIDERPKTNDVLSRYAFAYRQLQYLRWQATCAGGPFGHRLSYRISGYLQPVGRDYVHLLSGTQLSEQAFMVAEQLHARSMVDWMARSHHTNRLVRDSRLHGSLNAVMPAGPSEIRAIAQRLGASLLVYLETGGGYAVWLQPSDGELVADRIADPSALIRDLFAQFPYIAPSAGPAQLQRGQRSLRPVGEVETSLATLDMCLGELFHALLPAKVLAALGDEGRLVIVPDSLLEYVPFCALRASDGAYLVERFELVYWPSVTAWMLTQTAAETRAAIPDTLRSLYRRGRFTDPPAGAAPGAPKAVVVGDPDFGTAFTIRQAGAAQRVHLARLPGTELEADAVAALLNGVLLVGSEATLDNLLDRTNVVPILHLATHGVLVTERPEESFVGLSDGALTAGFLYQTDRPILAELVVMSACQTALGGEHPDSLVGLTNAFLIAGADTVASTLWQIDDARTVDLVTRFYRALSQASSVPAALRLAQLGILRQPELRHPYYWAAFKVVGSEANPLRIFDLLL